MTARERSRVGTTTDEDEGAAPPDAADAPDATDAIGREVMRALAQELGAPLPQVHAPSMDTLPGAPARPRSSALVDDDDFRALAAFCTSAREALRDRAWDNLAHVEAFARALRFCVSGTTFDAPLDAPLDAPRDVATDAPHRTEDAPRDAAAVDAPATSLTPRPGSQPPAPSAGGSRPPAPAPLLARLQDDVERRRIAEQLFALLPAAARARGLTPLPEPLAQRADLGFRLEPGDLPRIAPVLSAHLADDALLDAVLAPGARLLAPRALCPFAARGPVLLLVVDSHHGDVVRGRAQLADGSFVSERKSESGALMKTVDGQVQPIEARRDALLAQLLSAGPDARGLDLRFSDDRCLLLAYVGLLRTRGLFDALERAEALGLEARHALVRDCTRAAFDAVATYTMDPLACAITLEGHDGDLGWPERAWQLLDATKAVRDAAPRATRTHFARTALWLDAVAPPGFGASRLSAVAAGRAFARLVTSVLAPLGVLPCSGFKDGSGAVLLHTLLPAADGGNPLLSIEVARFGDAPSLLSIEDEWRAGRTPALPDPRGTPQHVPAAMPSFLSFFLEAADPSVAPSPEES